ncbi:MAG: HAMP domain-containing histidine kinase [Fimbriimonadales bacterium]|nr:HAMP domain-containing histidine kinase [Fimbriimonadales bacterium]
MLSRLLWRADARLGRMSRRRVAVVALFLAVAVGVADHFLAPDLLLLYLVPIMVAAWYGGRKSGMVVALYAAASAFLTQALAAGAGQMVDPVSIVNLGIRLASYLAMVWVVARLRESRRQQRDLVGFLVHDLRSPLSSAITGLLTLQQNHRSLDDEEREMIELALVSNQRALTLVNSILDVAKLEGGKMAVRCVDTDLGELIRQALEGLRLWARGAEVELVSEPRLDRWVLDPDLTSRVLTNLVGNALKFSPQGGSVVVTAEPDPHGVRFSVRDQGPGIPPEVAEEIFEPFVQVKGTRGGTGLGLTFCQLAVKAQGGRIGVQSQLGQGSTFWFVLPPHAPTSAGECEPDGE